MLESVVNCFKISIFVLSNTTHGAHLKGRDLL